MDDSQPGWTKIARAGRRGTRYHYWKLGERTSLCGQAFRSGNEKPLAVFVANANRCRKCEKIRTSGSVPTGFSCRERKEPPARGGAEGS